MLKLEKEFTDDFKLFKNNRAAYSKKVNEISKLFGLKDESELKSDYLPTYIVGNYNDNNDKYVLISLNPGFIEDQNKKEEEVKNGSLEEYHKFIFNFFKIFKEEKYYDTKKKKWRRFNSRYYSNFKTYIGTLLNIEIEKENQFDIYQDHLINIDLIPYHSSRFSSNYKLSDNVNKYLERRFESILDFINNHKNIKGVIFNGSDYLKIIKKLYPKDMKKQKRVIINDYNEINLFTLKGVKCIQHSFISRPGSHIKNKDKTKIAKTFLEYIK